MIKLKEIITESNVWERKFGESLPTLKGIMEKRQSIKEAKELSQKDIDFIAKLTDRNNHTRSRLELANHIGDKRLIRAYTGLIYVEELLRDANDTSGARSRLDKMLFYKAKKVFSNFDEIWKAF